MADVMRAKKRTPRFSTAWLAKYGLRVAAAARGDAQEPTSLSCRFCEAFGRTGRVDGDEGTRKRRRTTRVMMFTPPWRTEHMRTHMLEQHGAHYAQFSALGHADKDEFFAAPEVTGVAGVRPEADAPIASNGSAVATPAPSETDEPMSLESVAAPLTPCDAAPLRIDTLVMPEDSSLPSQPPMVLPLSSTESSPVPPPSSSASIATASASSGVAEQQQVLTVVEAYYSRVRRRQGQRGTSEAYRLVSEQVLAKGAPPAVVELLEKLPPGVRDGTSSCGFPAPFGIRGLHVLVLGCGSGRDAYLASQLVGVAGSVTAVEHAEELLQVARGHIGAYGVQLGVAYPNVHFVSGYSECLELAGVPERSVDFVIANGTLSVSPFKEQVLEQAFRALRVGGELCLCDVFVSRRLQDATRTHELLRGEWLGGAMYVEDFKRLCRQVGFSEPRLLRAVSIDTSRNCQVAALVGPARFRSATFRCFKAANVESGPDEEDYGQIATYNGSIAEYPFEYALDDAYSFEKGRPVRVGGNTAAILRESWLSRHFAVVGDRSVHFGPFDELAACGRRPAAGSER